MADTGKLTTDRLAAWTVDDAAATFGQLLDGGPAHELMTLYVQAWHDLAAFVDRVGDGSFLDTIAAADGSAARMVELLDEMPFFHDVHRHPVTGDVFFYNGPRSACRISTSPSAATVPAASPIVPSSRCSPTISCPTCCGSRECCASPMPSWPASRRSTTSRSAHQRRSRSGPADSMPSNSSAKHCRRRGNDSPPADLDNVLWNLGGLPRYKAIPRHRTRCVFY